MKKKRNSEYRKALRVIGIDCPCRECKDLIVWDNSRISDPGHKVIFKGRTHMLTKTVNGHIYHLQVCQDCYEKRWGQPRFNLMTDGTKWAFGVTDEDAQAIKRKMCATLDNMVTKYGEEEGKRRWDSYCARQVQTKSWEWMVENYGIEKAKEINRKKAEAGASGDHSIRVSKVSQDLFKQLDKLLPYKCEYYDNGGERRIDAGDHFYLLDFYIPELKVCVEFNGTIFHADPRIYEDNECCNPFKPDVTAAQIRQYDRKRMEDLERCAGIKTIVVWELDYNKSFDINKLVKEIEYINKK